MYVQLRSKHVEQADAVEFDVPAFHLGHPALCLTQGGSEVGLRHTEAEPCATCATADLFGFFQHQRAPLSVRRWCSSGRRDIGAPSVEASPHEGT